MSSEFRIARGALAWGALAVLPAAGMAFLIRGADGATSVAIAAGLILANTGAAALISVLAGRLGFANAAMMALPSFALRLSMLFAVLALLDGRSFIDEPSFAAAYCGVLVLVLAMEARALRRTPWLTLTFGPKERA